MGVRFSVVPSVRSSSSPRPATPAASQVPGENYQVCSGQRHYLTSPWTYHALGSGSRSYTVSQYKALPGYGTTLPPLPSYIAGESSTTEAAVIYAPGSSVSPPAYAFPETPLLHFFEGGATGRSHSRRYPATSSSAGPPPATLSQPSTMAVRQRESAPRTTPTISLAAPALWRLQHRPGLQRSQPGRPSAVTLAG